jgi:hypothetical protein
MWGAYQSFRKDAGMSKFCQTTRSYPFVTGSHQHALLSHYSLSHRRHVFLSLLRSSLSFVSLDLATDFL